MKAACISPDVNSRMRFKQIASIVPSISSLQVTGSLREVHEKLNGGLQYGAVFISDRFEEEVTREFILSGKKTPGGSDSAYMLVLNKNVESATTLAKYSLFGIDSFLFEPFSAESLSECISVAQSINQRRSSARQQASISVLISGIIKNVDDAWAQLCKGESAANSRKSLQHISSLLSTLSPELQTIYFDSLIEQTSQLPVPPQRPASKSSAYKGVSARIKRKLS